MRIRAGGSGDAPIVLELLDTAVAWLAREERTGQWGTEPWSTVPARVARIEGLTRDGDVWLAERDGDVVGAMVLTREPMPYVEPVDEPEVYVSLLVTDRSRPGGGAGAALLEHARAEAARVGADLLRVDCYAGDDGALVRYYERHGFTRVRPFTVGEWPGQLLQQRLGSATPPR
ncbi:GNAT family N-acetyltransferase [Actinomadura flavalba]|uniref:GNAT family N-acetyltransferase n=1 Tax=Actinomadura flavalba TaxID=1120938 RepID=UPI00036CBEB4|nr:GNAT family N-acetyltransferase [Actinomadura flavalba]